MTNAIKFDDGRGVAVSLRCETASPPARRPPRVSSCGTLAAALSLDSPRVSACSPAGEHNTCGAAQLPPTHTLVATVADRGPGIAPQDCERIFRPYEAASQASGGGAGLGLHIARACARRAGGDVCVESELGNGATFTLRFPVRVPADAAAEWEAVALHSWQQQPAQPPPVAPLTPSSSALDMCAMGVPKRGRVLPEAGSTLPCAVAAPASPPSSPAALLPLRCLLADDHPTNLLLVKRLLERQGGFVVTTAVNGKEAFERLVAAFEAGAPPHIAVIDMQARAVALARRLVCTHLTLQTSADACHERTRRRRRVPGVGGGAPRGLSSSSALLPNGERVGRGARGVRGGWLRRGHHEAAAQGRADGAAGPRAGVRGAGGRSRVLAMLGASVRAPRHHQRLHSCAPPHPVQRSAAVCWLKADCPPQPQLQPQPQRART